MRTFQVVVLDVLNRIGRRLVGSTHRLHPSAHFEHAARFTRGIRRDVDPDALVDGQALPYHRVEAPLARDVLQGIGTPKDGSGAIKAGDVEFVPLYHGDSPSYVLCIISAKHRPPWTGLPEVAQIHHTLYAGVFERDIHVFVQKRLQVWPQPIVITFPRFFIVVVPL